MYFDKNIFRMEGFLLVHEEGNGDGSMREMVTLHHIQEVEGGALSPFSY